jgi:DNA-binding response OmpR family regulator
MAKSIYIADDEKNIRDLIRTFLMSDGFIVETFDTGDGLFTRFQDKPCDLVILDIMMPGTDGLSICSLIRARSNVPIIIVSAKDSELDRITGITLGSDDYLVKPFSPIELTARVKAIFRRIHLDQSQIKQDILKFSDISLNLSAKEALLGNTKLDLTPTEFAFLTYMFAHQERAVSRAELLKNVWSFASDIDTRATDDVLKRLRKKMKDSRIVIEAVWGFGFKLAEVKDEIAAQ